MKIIMLLFPLLLSGWTVLADSIPLDTIAFQQEGFVEVPLGTGLDPLLNPTFPKDSNDLIFDTAFYPFDPAGLVEFSASVDVGGLDLTIDPTTISCPTWASECEVIFGFSMPAIDAVTASLLTVNVGPATDTYDFPLPNARSGAGNSALTGEWLAWNGSHQKER